MSDQQSLQKLWDFYKAFLINSAEAVSGGSMSTSRSRFKKRKRTTKKTKKQQRGGVIHSEVLFKFLHDLISAGALTMFFLYLYTKHPEKRPQIDAQLDALIENPSDALPLLGTPAVEQIYQEMVSDNESMVPAAAPSVTQQLSMLNEGIVDIMQPSVKPGQMLRRVIDTIDPVFETQLAKKPMKDTAAFLMKGTKSIYKQFKKFLRPEQKKKLESEDAYLLFDDIYKNHRDIVDTISNDISKGVTDVFQYDIVFPGGDNLLMQDNLMNKPKSSQRFAPFRNDDYRQDLNYADTYGSKENFEIDLLNKPVLANKKFDSFQNEDFYDNNNRSVNYADAYRDDKNRIQYKRIGVQGGRKASQRGGRRNTRKTKKVKKSRG